MKICHINKKDRFEVWLLNEIKFVIYGEPKGKGRPRVALRKFKNKDFTDGGIFDQIYER